MKFWKTTELRKLGPGNAFDVSIAIGRSVRAVQCKAYREGIEAPKVPHGRYWPEPVKARCMRLREDGFSVRQISNSTGVPFGTVRRWVYE